MSTDRTSAVVETKAGSHLLNELVVALAYQRVVLQQLESWSARPQVQRKDLDARLGLLRATLDPSAVVQHLSGTHPDWVRTARDEAQREGYASTDLDITVRCLRVEFRNRFNGWVPGFGKNRIVSRVHGSYVIDGGGGGGPTARPDYVIDGGGITGPPSGVSTVVRRRRARPGTGVRVGVVDTRVGQNPWLAGAYAASAEGILSEDPGRSLPPHAEHSTFVIGMILQQAPGAAVELRNGLNDHATADSWAVARSIADLASSNPDVVNLSLGCATDDNQPPMVLSAAINALGRNTVVVAAAGNHGDLNNDADSKPAWPAAMDTVIAVGARDKDEAAAFTPRGSWINAVAPGVDVLSTAVPGRRGGSLFATWSGTSFAAAAVSGAIAARVRPGMAPPEAWEELKKAAKRDATGVPIIPLRSLDTYLTGGPGAVGSS